MSDITPEVQNLLDRVPPSKGSGKYLDQLTPGGREVLDEFETWLKEVDGKTETTARAYKGYCAKAIVELTKDPEFELDTDVRSAINALRRFQAWTQAELGETEGDVPASGDVE